MCRRAEAASTTTASTRSCRWAISTIGKLAIPVGAAVNNYGDVTGGYLNPPCTPITCAFYPYVISEGEYRNLPFIAMTQGYAINDRSEVVGTTRMVDPDSHTLVGPVPFIYDGAKVKVIQTLGMVFTGINNDGLIVGYKDGQPFIYFNDAYTNIPVVGAAKPLAINDAGDVAGTGVVSGANQGFVYRQGVAGFVGVGPAPYSDHNELYALNNQGQAVGAMFSATFESRAMLYADGVLTDLNDVSDAPAVLTRATGISDGGEIAAVTSNGVPYVLVPNGQVPPNTCKAH